MKSSNICVQYGKGRLLKWHVLFIVLSAIQAVLFFAAAAHAVQFDYLDPGFTQQIYTGPLVGGPGMAWTSAGNLLTKAGSNILEYSLTQNATYQTSPGPATPIHSSIATHTISGLNSSGYGLTKGLDGKLYTPTGSGLQRFDPNNWAAPAQTLTGTSSQGYGITTLPDGRIAYSDGMTPSTIYLYSPSLLTNTPIYTAPYQVDDIEASATGAIAMAGRGSFGTIDIIDNLGNLINTFATGVHFPDGLAFGDGVTANWLYSNNNDGSITQYQLGPNYSGTPIMVDIATQSPLPLGIGRAYGDLASVGPDCAFYVTQFDNFGLNGSDWGVGTHWDNGVTTNEASIIRIAAIDRNGVEYCGFGTATEDVPEPGTLMLILASIVPLLLYSRRVRAARS
jgi:hypothetical protein